MIAFATAIQEPEPYRRYARPGIELAAEPDSVVYAFSAVGSMPRGSNLLLEAAAARDDLEALVVVQPETEIADPGFCGKVRAALAEEEVAVAGALGATGVRSIAWWDGAISAAPTVHRYGDFGGGELRGFPWKPAEAPLGEVDAVDGFLLVLSPWAVRNVRFDESLVLGHGYDVDYCLQVRSAGRKVVTADLRTIRHRGLELVEEHEAWVEAHIRAAEKWDGRVPGLGREWDGDWKSRARRAEAEREAVRTRAYSNNARRDVRIRALEHTFEEATGTVAWRATAPLREANRLRRELRLRLAGRD
jgi:Glycosyltransferase like family